MFDINSSFSFFIQMKIHFIIFDKKVIIINNLKLVIFSLLIIKRISL